MFDFFQIHDSTLSGSSDDDDFLSALRGPSSFANAFLYVGLGTVALGLVVLFVGTGEKGFKTVELRLIGPALIGTLAAVHLFNKINNIYWKKVPIRLISFHFLFVQASDCYAVCSEYSSVYVPQAV